MRILPTSLAPIIDGKLDDVCWKNAPVIRDFTQVEPKEGAEPGELTEVRLLYDKDVIYIAIRCHDREPARILAAEMQQDSDLSSDDSVTLIFDTFGRHRSGYSFKMNPAGAKQDGLIGPDGDVKKEWDAIWFGRSRIDEQGWTAEIAIPFKSLAFDPHTTVWRFNIERLIRRRQEKVRWAAPFKNKSVRSLVDLGELRDLSGIRQGLGIDFKPFTVLRYSERRDGSDDGLDFKPGFDLFYNVTPSLSAALTVNTDFAETEVDARQVNLTRFPLFFPEKRDFFLRDAGLFAFDDYRGPVAFHSRRIGLGASGETVDILAGGKVAGRIGDLDIGLLDVQVDDSKNVASKNLAVGRLSYRVLDESSIGGIFTYGDPRRDAENYVVGADAHYRNHHVLGQNSVKVDGWILKSEAGDADGRQLAFGGAVRYPNDPFRAEVSALQVDPDFDPGLGFVRRRDVREYRGSSGYTWWPGGFVRTVDLDVSSYIATNLENTVESETWTVPALQLSNNPGDTLYVGFTSNRENLFEGFEINPGVVIPSGDYRFNRAFASFTTSSARPVSGFVSCDFGQFYDGTDREFGAGAEWRISPHIFVGATGQFNQIELPGGSFDVLVDSVQLNISITPNLSWNTIVQHDNVSNTLGVSSRIKWIIQPGNQLFLVFNRGFDVENGRFQTLSTDIVTKLVWTLRF